MDKLLKELKVGKFSVKSPKEYTPEELLEYYYLLRISLKGEKSNWSTEAFCNDLQNEILERLRKTKVD